MINDTEAVDDSPELKPAKLEEAAKVMLPAIRARRTRSENRSQKSEDDIQPVT